ncbi:RluA family pseudouridine synthase [Chitinophaga japonensis]|uniref:23S rRNA pseudouridine1911/1915/1917 synthase n=1 Tax=Chitinophaga japonensis TaxID=104662 RepID=A0A562TG56_CHIJA|nr:RNA pseudouridine synthase [Chitinophaga japonensis]TWI92234.1 23S rRNA pseudouridine1911/1915/1917 synthase [Chitinophaga japonensis]
MRINDLLVKVTDDYIVLNKPAGLLTIPDRHDNEIPSLQTLLKKAYSNIFTVHRLDRDTSGLILFARNEAAHRYFSQLFESREVKKYYAGLVSGQPVPLQGSIDEPIMEHPVQKGKMVANRKGKAALTDYEVLETFGLYSFVRLQIHTGRTHQIRVHMKHLGHPIVVDELYGNPAPILLSAIKKKYRLGKYTEEERPLLGRLGLHAWQLHFTDNKGVEQQLEAPLPKDMQAVLNQLRKNR